MIDRANRPLIPLRAVLSEDEELSSNVSKLAKQLNNQADAFRELHAQVADQDRKSEHPHPIESVSLTLPGKQD